MYHNYIMWPIHILRRLKMNRRNLIVRGIVAYIGIVVIFGIAFGIGWLQ